MSDDTVERLLGAAEAHIRDTILVRHKSLMPTWVIIDKDGNPHINGTPWADENERIMAKLLMRKLIKNYKAQAYSFITEAWMASAPEDWKPGDELPVQPRKNPARKEIAMAFATDGTKNVLREWMIRRDWQDRVIALDPLKDHDGMTGWMMELLK